jgi:PAS domain S-box-containing protein
MLGFESAEQLIRERTDIRTQHYVDEHCREELKRLLHGYGIVRGFEYEAYRRDGSKLWMSDNVRAVRDDTGRILYYEGTTDDITGRRNIEAQRKRTQDALRNYSRRLIEAQEAERQRIARELHDEIGQILTAVGLNLQAARASCQTSSCVSYSQDNIALVDEALRMVRDLSFDLRPSLLDDLGLVAALQWYVERYAQRSGLEAQVIADSLETEERLPRNTETAAFRIVQEALTNVVRHAQAKSVLVELESNQSELVVKVKDDGLGFDHVALMRDAAPIATLGLRGMEERAVALGGKLMINSDAGGGTEVCARLPISLL